MKKSDWQSVSNSAILKAGITPFSGVVAVEMKLPVAAEGSTIYMVLRRAQIGAPFLSRQTSFAFGSVVLPPVRDENGVLLSGPNASSYYLQEPYTTTGHTNSGYYWSPHARVVYGVQAGPIAITWIKAAPYTSLTVPAYTNLNGTASFTTNGANIFLLSTERYIVSGSPVKPPRKMYWTQKGFQNIGKPVVVPTARVGAVNVIYNSTFPKAVLTEFLGVGSSSPTDGSTNATLQ